MTQKPCAVDCLLGILDEHWYTSRRQFCPSQIWLNLPATRALQDLDQHTDSLLEDFWRCHVDLGDADGYWNI
jgi:hypothetical protein